MNPKIIIKKELLQTGYSLDGRQISAPQLAEIYQHTYYHVVERGILCPVKLGHKQSPPQLQGRLIDLELEDTAIIGTFEITGNLAREYEAGALPSLSVELFARGYDQQGKGYGPYIGAIALLGTEPAAFPHLMTLEASLQQYQAQSHAIPATKEVQMEDPSFFQKLKDRISGSEKEGALSETLNRLRERINILEADLAEKTAQLQEFMELKADQSFSRLRSTGHIGTDEREKFDKLVQASGLDFAVEWFSAYQTPQRPPQQEEVQSQNQKSTADPEVSELIQVYTKAGVRPEVIAKDLNLTVEQVQKYQEENHGAI